MARPQQGRTTQATRATPPAEAYHESAAAHPTRAQIISAAERLLGEGGIEAVPFKDILAAAGQKNQSAIQYHFGSRAGLIAAVIEARMRSIDVLRLEMAERAQALKGQERREALMRTILLPLLDALERDAQGAFYIKVSFQALQRGTFDPTELMSQLPGGRALARAITDGRPQALNNPRGRLRTRLVAQLMFVAADEWFTHRGQGETRERLVTLFARAAEAILFS